MAYRAPLIQATSVPGNTAVDGSLASVDDAAVRNAGIANVRAADAVVDASAGSMQQADAQRAMPRARTDNLNDASGRRLTTPGDVVERPSAYSHRMNRRNANRAIAHMNPAQKRVAAGFINPQNTRQQQIRDGLNAHFENGGSVNSLPPSARAMTRQIDSAIQKAERENDRMHVVYTSLNFAGDDRDAFMRALARNPGQSHTLLGYTRANHDINAVNGNDQTVYVQIETARGMYVGNEGSSGHLLPRGVQLEYVGTHEFDVDDGQGNLARRQIVQMREVRQNERTTARS